MKKLCQRIAAVMYAPFATFWVCLLGETAFWNASKIVSENSGYTVQYDIWSLVMYIAILLALTAGVILLLMVAFRSKPMPKITVVTLILLGTNALLLYLVPTQAYLPSMYSFAFFAVGMNVFQAISFLFTAQWFLLISVLAIVATLWRMLWRNIKEDKK